MIVDSISNTAGRISQIMEIQMFTEPQTPNQQYSLKHFWKLETEEVIHIGLLALLVSIYCLGSQVSSLYFCFDRKQSPTLLPI